MLGRQTLDERFEKLAALDAETLAGALLKLALTHEAADEVVDRLLASPAQNLSRYRRKLAQLRHRDRFIDWRGADGFANELILLLDDLQAAVTDPLEGFKQVAAFYETDEAIFEQCDDSSGSVGWVFSHNALNLLIDYGSRCEDEEALLEIIFNLCKEDPYGARGQVIDCAVHCLSEANLRTLIARFQELAAKRSHSDGKRSALSLVESLAQQIEDPKLFEETRLESWGKDSPAGMLAIARVYFENDDMPAALAWLEKMPADDGFREREKKDLLMDICRKLGDREQLEPMLRERFRSSYAASDWTELLGIAGPDREATVVAREVEHILAHKKLVERAALFLISIGKIDEAEAYLLQRHQQIKGYLYGTLLELAEKFVAHDRSLVASIIYRELLRSILERGNAKAYRHGANYLHVLDKLEPQVANWQQFETHDQFKQRIYQDHRRKRSFWPQYKGALD